MMRRSSTDAMGCWFLSRLAVEVALIRQQSQSGTYLHAIFHVALRIGHGRQQHQYDDQCLFHLSQCVYSVMAVALLSHVLVDMSSPYAPISLNTIQMLPWLSVVMAKGPVMASWPGRS